MGKQGQEVDLLGVSAHTDLVHSTRVQLDIRDNVFTEVIMDKLKAVKSPPRDDLFTRTGVRALGRSITLFTLSSTLANGALSLGIAITNSLGNSLAFNFNRATTLGITSTLRFGQFHQRSVASGLGDISTSGSVTGTDALSASTVLSPLIAVVLQSLTISGLTDLVATLKNGTGAVLVLRNLLGILVVSASLGTDTVEHGAAGLLVKASRAVQGAAGVADGVGSSLTDDVLATAFVNSFDGILAGSAGGDLDLGTLSGDAVVFSRAATFGTGFFASHQRLDSLDLALGTLGVLKNSGAGKLGFLLGTAVAR